MSRRSPSRPSRSTRSRFPNLQRSTRLTRRSLLPNPLLPTTTTPRRQPSHSSPSRLPNPKPPHPHPNPNRRRSPSSTRGQRRSSAGAAASPRRDSIPSPKSTAWRATTTPSRSLARRAHGGETTVPVDEGGAPESRRRGSRSPYPIMSVRGTGADGGWRSASNCIGGWCGGVVVMLFLVFWRWMGAFDTPCCTYVLLGLYIPLASCVMSCSVT